MSGAAVQSEPRQVLVTALLPRPLPGRDRATRVALAPTRQALNYSPYHDPSFYFVWPQYGPPLYPQPPCMKTLDRIEEFVRAEAKAAQSPPAVTASLNIIEQPTQPSPAEPASLDADHRASAEPTASDTPVETKPRDYAVGYGKPPREHQFRKNDGRPRGRRPKGTPNAFTIIRKVHARPVYITEKSKRKRVSSFEALMHADMANALLKNKEKSVERQIRYGFQIAAEDESKAATQSLQEMLAEDRVILDRYFAQPTDDDDASPVTEAKP